MLSDFEIELGATSAPAGEVTFKVQNTGPSVHEFVVFQTDLEPDALPVDAPAAISWATSSNAMIPTRRSSASTTGRRRMARAAIRFMIPTASAAG